MLNTSQALCGYHMDSFTSTPVGTITVAARSAHAHQRSAYSRDRNPQTTATRPATIRLWMKKWPCTTTPIAPIDKTSAPAVTKPTNKRLACWLRSCNRAAESGTESMIACHVQDSSSIPSDVATGSSNSSLWTVSPGAGIGGSAMRATATVSLAAFVKTISPHAMAPVGTQYCHPYPYPMAAPVTAIDMIAMNDASSARLRGPPRVANVNNKTTAPAPAICGAPNESTPRGSGTASAAAPASTGIAAANRLSTMSTLSKRFLPSTAPPSTASPTTPSATGQYQLCPVRDHATSDITVIASAATGIARPTNRFSAAPSNSGDSSRTAIASITSSTSGR